MRAVILAIVILGLGVVAYRNVKRIADADDIKVAKSIRNEVIIAIVVAVTIVIPTLFLQNAISLKLF